MAKAGKRDGAAEFAAAIEAKIASGVLPPGARLLPMRELAAEYNLSMGLIRRGLGDLQQKGLLECRRGDGVFVRAAAMQIAGRRILVFVDNTRLPDHYGLYVVLGIQDAALRLDVAVELRQLTYYDETVPSRELAELAVAKLSEVDHSYAGVIFVGNYDLLPKLPLSCPAVGVSMSNRFGGLVSPVSMDPGTAAELAVEFFRKHRIERVKIISFAPPVVKELTQAFRNRWEQCEIIDRENWSGTTAELFADDQAGYLFLSGSSCEGNCQLYRRETGRALSADRTLLSMDGKSRLIAGYEQVNTIAPDWRQVGEAAFDELIRRISHPGTSARRIYLDVKLDEITREGRQK